jgi:hypothetical protein
MLEELPSRPRLRSLSGSAVNAIAATAACSAEAVSRCKSDTRIAQPNQDGSLFQRLHEELNGPPRIAAILYNGPWVAGYSGGEKR